MNALWATVVAWLKSVQPHLVQGFKLAASAFLGAKLEQGRVVENEMAKLDRAGRAASRVDFMSDDDVTRELGKRGLFQLFSESPRRE